VHVILSLAGGTLHSLGRVSAGALAIALALHVLKVVAEARSWHTIVRHAYPEADVTFGTTFGGFAGAIAANTVLPARIGEALRLGILRRRLPGSSTATIATTIVLEGVVELIFGVVVVAAVLVAGRSLGTSGSPLAGLRFVGAHPLALALSLAGLAGLAVIVVRKRHRLRSLAARMAQGASILHSPRAFVCGVLGWKVIAWSLRLAAVYFFLLAFHVTAGIWAVLLVVGTQSAVAALPISPGNAGTQQAAFLVVLAGSGSMATVLGFGLGMQASLVIIDVVTGCAAMWFLVPRLDLAGALGISWVAGRRSPSGVLQSSRSTLRS
jgi:uncharacterized membrane protein YbhN (UPF0104 family)